MREIKFRFWDLTDGKWMVDGRTETSIFDFAFRDGMNWRHITKVEAKERVAVMQFTGLEDKNGKEIYEGDIVIAEYGKYKGTVKWDNGYLDYRLYTIPEHCYYRLGELDYNGIEVIGNIHDQPAEQKEGK